MLYKFVLNIISSQERYCLGGKDRATSEVKGGEKKQCQVTVKISDEVNTGIVHSLTENCIYNPKSAFSLPDTHTDFVVLVKTFSNGW